MASILDCRKIQPRLSEYVDGTLSRDDAWEIEKHLGTCAVCARVADDFAATTRLLQTLPAAAPSADFDARLAARLADQALTPRPLGFWGRLRLAWEERPRAVRAAAASGVAFACLVPVLAVVTLRARPGVAPNVVASAEPSSLDEIVRVHVRASSSEPLGESTGVLLAAGGASSGDGTGF